jgi:hypothetical protein
VKAVADNAIHSRTYMALLKLRMVRFQYDPITTLQTGFVVDSQTYTVDDRAPLNLLVEAIAKEYS